MLRIAFAQRSSFSGLGLRCSGRDPAATIWSNRLPPAGGAASSTGWRSTDSRGGPTNPNARAVRANSAGPPDGPSSAAELRKRAAAATKNPDETRRDFRSRSRSAVEPPAPRVATPAGAWRKHRRSFRGPREWLGYLPTQDPNFGLRDRRNRRERQFEMEYRRAPWDPKLRADQLIAAKVHLHALVHSLLKSLSTERISPTYACTPAENTQMVFLRVFDGLLVPFARIKDSVGPGARSGDRHP